MAQQLINLGTTPDSGTGDQLRTGGTKINANFTELYGLVNSSGLTVGTTAITGGTSTRILYDNAGKVGEYTLTGSGTVVAMQTAPTFLTSITSPIMRTGSDTGTVQWGAADDLFLYRDAANTLAFRNSTNAQTYRVYTTFTDASNYERFEIVTQAGGSTILRQAAAGTGSPRALEIRSVSGTLILGDGNADVTISSGIISFGARSYSTSAAATQSGTSYAMGQGDSSLIFSNAGTVTLTLLSAGGSTGRWLHVKNIAGGTLVSASSNVVPISSATPGTAILAAGPGKWALLQSDGSNWIIMASN